MLFQLARAYLFTRKLFSTARSEGMIASELNGASAAGDVFLVPMFSDNYGHILVDRNTKKAALIDPADYEPVVKAVRELGFSVEMALITHKHADHCGGNEGVKTAFPGIRVVGTGYESIPGATESAKEGDILKLGSLQIEVLHTPCHTTGHVGYYVTAPSAPDAAPILFPGDTLFVGGCGRFFEGTAGDMLKNMDRFGRLPPQTQVFCAHEYTASNLKFLASVDPDGCGKVLDDVLEKRSRGVPTVPSTIGKELQYNLFMKTRDAKVQSLVGTGDAEATMAKLREMKNNF